jgi:NAD+ synthase/NAD+ synthase (glutamine-hydrolysing)
MKIALAQINPTVGDFEGNAHKILAFAEKAKDLDYDLVVFSEMVVCGYPPRDLLEKEAFVSANMTHVGKLVESIKGIGVICGFAEKNQSEEGNPLCNSAALFEDGVILHQVRKRLLPTYDVFDETRYFEPGDQFEAFAYKGCRIGLTVCEDVWSDTDYFTRRLYSVDPVARIVEAGADIIINVSASPFYMGKREIKWEMLGEIARKYRVPLVYVNQVGGNDSVLFDGLSVAFDGTGQLVSRARDFQEDMVFFDTEKPEENLHPISESDVESLLNALLMGTRDYTRKCGFKKVLVGLSGGIDSALTVSVAAQALGKENVLGVFMPSQYTSAVNFEDTSDLARNLGIELIQIPIEGVFEKFLQELTPVLGDVTTEVTGQNIQARIRGTLLMALSNKLGSLLLSTGNKSELAVGYCTLYGDMSGGLAVISDVPKTLVYELARFINKERKEAIPKRILEKPPSAELKPDQFDQDDLPPYDILDGILRAYIEENKGPEEIIAEGFDPDVVREIVWRMERNEYKRHQAPPGLKVTTKSFGYGRRYPMARGYQKTYQ